jgi:hypothetical protein
MQSERKQAKLSLSEENPQVHSLSTLPRGQAEDVAANYGRHLVVNAF